MTMWIKLGLIAALVAGIAAAAAGTYYAGHRAGVDSCQSQQQREADLIRQVKEATEKSIAAGLSNLKIENKTIVGRVEREIRTNTVYRDCVHAPGVLDDLNRALGHGAVRPGDRAVPAPEPAAR